MNLGRIYICLPTSVVRKVRIRIKVRKNRVKGKHYLPFCWDQHIAFHISFFIFLRDEEDEDEEAIQVCCRRTQLELLFIYSPWTALHLLHLNCSSFTQLELLQPIHMAIILFITAWHVYIFNVEKNDRTFMPYNRKERERRDNGYFTREYQRLERVATNPKPNSTIFPIEILSSFLNPNPPTLIFHCNLPPPWQWRLQTQISYLSVLSPSSSSSLSSPSLSPALRRSFLTPPPYSMFLPLWNKPTKSLNSTLRFWPLSTTSNCLFRRTLLLPPPSLCSCTLVMLFAMPDIRTTGAWSSPGSTVTRLELNRLMIGLNLA